MESIGWEESAEADFLGAVFNRLRRFEGRTHREIGSTIGRGYSLPLPVGSYSVTLWISARDCSAGEGSRVGHSTP